MDEFSIKIRRRFPRRVFQWGGNKITRREEEGGILRQGEGGSKLDSMFLEIPPLVSRPLALAMGRV